MRAWFVRAFGVALVLAGGAVWAAPAVAPAQPALWRVQNGDSTLYLFGSLHILPEDLVWTTPAIRAAMDASEDFIFEVPIDEAALEAEKQFIIEHGFLPRRQTLRSVLSPVEFQKYASVMKRAGLKAMFYERYQPWLASLVLGLAYLHADDIDQLSGADDTIKDYARERGKSLIYLESARDQMQLLTAGDRSGQVRALKNLLISLQRSRAQERELLQTWSSGDAKAFTALLEGYFEGRADAAELLINSRNRNWMPALREILTRPGATGMATVGAAHIGGKNGLIALLCGQGYEVERVGDNGAPNTKECSPGA